jgi:hypothetical protein
MGRSRRKTLRRRPRRSRSGRRHTRQRGGNAGAPGATNPVTFVFTNGAGFFSTFFFLCNASFVAKDTGAPFKIAHDNWQYTAEKGWHDYFTTLEEGAQGQGPQPQGPRFQHGQAIGKDAYPASRYESAIAEIYKPRQEYLDKAAAFIKTMGSPYTALYVRRGDKTTGNFKEMDLVPLPKILEDTGIKDDGRTLFIQTDDYAVVEEAKKLLPSCKIFTQAKEAQRGAVHGDIKAMGPDQRREHMEQILVGNAVFAGATEGWADGRSNMGRFLKLANFDKVKVYPKGHPGESLTREKVIKPFSGF